MRMAKGQSHGVIVGMATQRVASILNVADGSNAFLDVCETTKYVRSDPLGKNLGYLQPACYHPLLSRSPSTDR